MAATFRRRPNRLPLGNYADHHFYLLTLASHGRRNVFAGSAAPMCVTALRIVATKHAAGILAYCFMPDHVHLLVHCPERTFLPDFIRDFKQATGFRFKKQTGCQLWQKSYHDHVLRSEESVMDAARYIVANPVRAGLVADPSAYELTGSFVWDRDALMEG